MKTRIRLLVSMVFAVPVLAFAAIAIVNAEGGTSPVSGPATTTTGDSVKPDDKQLMQRLADRKTELNIKLTTVEQAHIKDRCKVAQGAGVNSLEGRVKGVETSRNEVYRNLVNRLADLDAKLKAKKVDTTKLEAEIAILKTKIATFQADLAKYKQALVDLKSMDCVADPTAFKASLESARTLREQLLKDATDVKSYVTDTIKPTLKDIRAQLEAQEKTSTTTNTGTGGNQ